MAEKEYKHVGTHAQDLPGGRVLAPGEVATFKREDIQDLVNNGVMVAVDELEAEAPEATDSASELAKKEGVNLSVVKGTGKDGTITKDDVEKVVKEGEEE